MFSDQRFGILRGPCQMGQGGGIPDVAQGHADISQKAAPLGPQDGRPGETGLEPGPVELQKFNQVRRGQVFPRLRLH